LIIDDGLEKHGSIKLASLLALSYPDDEFKLV
jgi:hypothetical protein